MILPDFIKWYSKYIKEIHQINPRGRLQDECQECLGVRSIGEFQKKTETAFKKMKEKEMPPEFFKTCARESHEKEEYF